MAALSGEVARYWRRVAGTAVLLVAFTGCGHKQRPRGHDLGFWHALIDRFPQCDDGHFTAVAVDTAAQYPMASYLGRRVSLRGNLVASPGECTAMECYRLDLRGREQDACCNQCQVSWLLTGRSWAGNGSVRANHVLVRVAGDAQPLQSTARDCNLRAFLGSTQRPLAEVIATGDVRSAIDVGVEEQAFALDDARLCVIWRSRMYE